MQLFWSPKSPFVRKVMIVLHETGQVDDVELTRMPVQMSEPNPEVLKVNPLNKIPTLVRPGATSLFDSRVICEFFDRRHGEHRFFPEDQEDYLRAVTLQALGDGLLDLLLVWRNWYLERGLAFDDPADSYTSAFLLKTQTTLDHLETLATELEETPFGIGHVSIGIALAHLDFRWSDLQWRHGRTALAAWHAEFSARPSVQATAIVDDTAPTVC
ncbi:MAG: glutathione S-transferase [Hyphomicrobiales bacterium]|nr:MAG: glutathione S-transferase [Hyphomicrobiales bacterium]